MTKNKLNTKKPYPYNMFLFYIFILIYLEFTLRIFTIGNAHLKDILLVIVFSLTFATAFYILTNIFKNKDSFYVSIILTAAITLVFVSQLIYYKIFNMFYTIYSAKNSSQIFEFWREILVAVSENILLVLLLFLPLCMLVLGRRRFFPLKECKIRIKLVLGLCMIIFHILGTAVIYATDRGPNSSYDVYYNTSFPLLSMEKLGLITTMRLDIQRYVTGWSPTLSVMSPKVEGERITKEEDIVTEYNTMDIDFDQLISEEENKEIKEMHQYFKEVKPTAKNEYTGKYKGYNLILITAEGFSPYAVHEEVMPTLYKMIHKGYHFTNFYTPLWEVSTTDGEYVANTGLIPKSGVWSFYESSNNAMPFAMGNQLRQQGYKTMAYHNHTYDYYKRHLSHPNMGYDYKGLGNGLKITKIWPESDLEMMEKTISEYIDQEPFHAYYMTISGHLRYTFSGNNMAAKNKDIVKDLPYSENARAYIATQVEFDRAMGYLLNKLEEAGIADKTLIAISADHYPYGLKKEEINELAGHDVEENFELYRNHFILYTKGMEPKVIDKPCSSLDIIPTISNLLGLEYDSRLLMGSDIFSDSEPLVIFLNRSFITEKGTYYAPKDEFISKGGQDVSEDYIDKMASLVKAKFYYSAKILETDYYHRVLQENR